jgi:hemoglobin
MTTITRKMPLTLLLAATLLGSCSKNNESPAPTTTTQTLYDRLGGLPAVSAVVDQFITNVVAESMTPNSNLKRTFNPLIQSGNSYRVASLRNHLIDQIGQAAGGPLQYKGLSMPAAHQGMNITDAEFNALVAELGKAMTTKGVPAAQQAEVVNILAPLKSSIVGK